MSDELRAIGYDAVITFTWAGESDTPGAAAKQGPRLANVIRHASMIFPEGEPVDLHLIGHSEGNVVHSQALISLEASTTPQLAAGYVRATLLAGADKVSINSAAIRTPELIDEGAWAFGSQCIVVAIDPNWTDGHWEVFINGGRVSTGKDAVEWAQEVERRGAGGVTEVSVADPAVVADVDTPADYARLLAEWGVSGTSESV